MPTHTLDLKLNERQIEFFGSHAKYILYGGAKGGGKSWSIRWKQIHRRLKYPGSRGLTLRRTHPELLRTHIERIQLEIPKAWGCVYNESKKTLTFPNGSVQEFGSCQYERDVQNYQGAEYDDIGIDEATQFTEYQFDVLRTNIRTTRMDLKTQIYLGANPGGVGHGWVKRRFITPITPDSDYAFVAAKVYDNPVLMTASPEYVQQLESLPEKLRRAFLEGDWSIFEGQVFGEWREDHHVTGQFDWPLANCKKLICFDWGYNAPGCAIWLAVTPENKYGVRHVYAYRELYQNGKSPEEWAQDLKTFMAIESVDYMVLPHDCFAHQGGRQSIADTFRQQVPHLHIREGHTLERGARQNRLALTHQFLGEGADGKPYFQSHVNCRNLNRTLPELIYDEHNPEDLDSDGEDHAYDALSLGFLSLSFTSAKSGAVKPVQPQRQRTTVSQNTDGSFPAPDFWGAIREKANRPQSQSWEYR